MNNKNHLFVLSICCSMLFLNSCTKEPRRELPIVTTLELWDIKGTSAYGGGEVVDDGGLFVSSRGVIWGELPNVSFDNYTDYEDCRNSTGIFSSLISGFEPETSYYYRAYATNSLGTSYGEELTFTTLTLSVGDLYQGGVVGYILKEDDPGFIPSEVHGLIIAENDLGSATWCHEGKIVINTSTLLGTGLSNTNKIVAVCAASNSAAKLCYDLNLNGFGDWFLPSRDELRVLIQNKEAIGVILDVNYGYWSSSISPLTNFNSTYVWVVYYNGNEMQYWIPNSFIVHPVRYF